jgi:hypothetical protein
MTVQEIIDQYFEADPTGATHRGDVVALLRDNGAYTPDIEATLAAYRQESFPGSGTWLWGLIFKAETYNPKMSRFREPRWRKTPFFSAAGMSATTFMSSAIGED